ISSMTASTLIVMILSGKEAISVVRLMTGATNGRQAAPGTIRGDFAMSNQENIVHASSSAEDAAAEIKRFFSPGEIYDYRPVTMKYINGPSE
ncbi:MAG: nucleoside-diphosphate kinase, partial [Duncaniella sp.]|nr:nucleoside-diphosphate kinase [Duncaniella sp.]